jgi:N utilization substance protein B
MTEKTKAKTKLKKHFPAEKRASRLMAVQALYVREVTEGTLAESLASDPDALIEHVIEIFEESEHEGRPTLATINKGFVLELIDGVMEHRAELDAMITAHLNKSWTLERISSLLAALLRTAIYEMMEKPNITARTIINEYVDMANAFFEKKEVGFVNGILDAIAHKLRPAEFKK